MQRVTVTATRWALGWELKLECGGVTQARTLAQAPGQVRDYLDTVDPGTHMKTGRLTSPGRH